MTIMRQYEKHEFCKDVSCYVLDLIEIGHLEKSFCERACVKTAWEFHDWLKKKDFKIVLFESCDGS